MKMTNLSILPIFASNQTQTKSPNQDQKPLKTYLKFVEFKDLVLWDVKRYFKKEVITNFELVDIKIFAQKYTSKVQLYDEKMYKRIRIKTNGKGVELRDIETGKNIKTKSQFKVKDG